jgi:hypothetical protein
MMSEYEFEECGFMLTREAQGERTAILKVEHHFHLLESIDAGRFGSPLEVW